jgi:phosphatidylglycerophosphate synthase
LDRVHVVLVVAVLVTLQPSISVVVVLQLVVVESVAQTTLVMVAVLVSHDDEVVGGSVTE